MVYNPNKLKAVEAGLLLLCIGVSVGSMMEASGTNIFLSYFIVPGL